MYKKIIHTDQAPAAIGAYSQAVEVAGTVYISGQIPLDPQTMEMVSDEFEQQARQVFKNLVAIISEAGASEQDAAKLTVYLTDLDNFATLNNIMGEFFSEPYPARAAVQVAALPKGAQVEVDAVLVRNA